MTNMYTLDFETEGLNKNSLHAPMPIGVSVKYNDEPSKYYALGHVESTPILDENDPRMNISKFQVVKDLLDRVWATADGIVCHNAKFDIRIVEEYFMLPRLPAYKYHCTQILLFLYDPNSKNLGLKPASEQLLGIPPEEKDALGLWFLHNQPVPGVKVTLAGKYGYMGYLKYAPAEVVAPYAEGDTERTYGLFQFLYPKVSKEAYIREQCTLCCLLDLDQVGVCVDTVRLREDLDICMVNRNIAIDKLQEYLGIKCNIQSPKELLQALIDTNKVDVERLLKTPKGNYSVTEVSLKLGVNDPKILELISYIKKAANFSNTFMKNWLAIADTSNGKIYTEWNQTKKSKVGDSGLVGARTGRLSSTPNFQNIPNSAEFLDTCNELGLKPLPDLKTYIVASEGYTLIGSDWKQQELRLLAHFEGGVLKQSYLDDCNVDIHALAQKIISQMVGCEVPRKLIKIIGFGIIYGMGLPKLARSAGVSISFARTVKAAYLNLFTGIKRVTRELSRRAYQGKPYYTWGKRPYYCEVSADPDKDLAYKMINTLIQGSAGDCLKQAIINYLDTKPDSHRLLLTVHDEILIEAPIGEAELAVEILKNAMESIDVSVPLLTDITIYGDRWGSK